MYITFLLGRVDQYLEICILLGVRPYITHKKILSVCILWHLILFHAYVDSTLK